MGLQLSDPAQLSDPDSHSHTPASAQSLAHRDWTSLRQKVLGSPCPTKANIQLQKGGGGGVSQILRSPSPSQPLSWGQSQATENSGKGFTASRYGPINPAPVSPVTGGHASHLGLSFYIHKMGVKVPTF